MKKSLSCYQYLLNLLVEYAEKLINYKNDLSARDGYVGDSIVFISLVRQIIISLLAVLLSANYIVAPISIRAQSADDKGEDRLKAINQVTSYSLQMLSREQGRNNSEKALPLEDQIGQRIEPTTKCNNQGNNFDCYLMMDPAELKNIEEGLEALGEVLGISGRGAVIPERTMAEGEGTEASSVGTREGDIASNVNFCALSISSPSSTSAILNTGFETAQEKIAKITTQIEQAKQASKEKQGGENSWLWDRIATKLEQARDSWNKVHELVEQGNKERVSLWRKAAEESEASGEKMKEAIISYISGDESTAKQIEKASWSAFHLSSAFTWLLKSEEALEKAEQNGEGDFWGDIAEQYKIAAYYKKKAAEAHDLEKENEECFWSWAGTSAYGCANYHMKMWEAQKINKIELATDYKNASELSRCAVDQYKKSVEIYIAGKESESNSWYGRGRSLQSQADYQAKAAEAQESGKIQLAAGYREAVAISECAANQWKLSAETKAAGKNSEGVSWGNEGESLQKKADYQAKASDAQEAGKEQLAGGYREVAILYQRAADKHRQAAESKAEEKTSEGNSWGWEGTSLQAVADYQAKACEAEEAGKAILEAGYKEAAATSERAADQWELSAKTKASGKNSEGVSWGNEGESLQKKANYQAKASDAQEAGKAQLAGGYREAVLLSQRAADQHRQAAEAASIGKETESTSWYWGGKSLQTMADYHAKAYETAEAGKVALTAGYKEVALMSQQAADQRKLAVLAYATEKKDEGESWDSAGKAFQSQADYYKKAIEAVEAGKEALAAAYKEMAAIVQRAAEKQKESALAFVSVKDGCLLYCEGESLQEQADYQAKALEAGEAGKATLAAGYKEVAVIYQRAVDQWGKGVDAFTLKKEKEGTARSDAAMSLVRKASYHKKVIETQEKGKAILSAGYGKATEISQVSAEYYQQAAEAFALGKEDEGTGWMNIGKFLQSKEKNQINTAEQTKKMESEKSAIKTMNGRINPEIFKDNKIINSNSVINRKKMALSICCEKWLTETKSAEGSIKILSDYVLDVLKCGADHVLVGAFEKYWSYVAKAHELGDDPQALAWIQVAEDIQQAIKDSIQQTKTSKNNELSQTWKNTAEKGLELAEYREKYIQATTSSQSPEVIIILKKVVEGLQPTVTYLRKAAEARSLKNEQEYERFNNIATVMTKSVNNLKKAVDAFQKSIDIATQGEVEVSTLWRKIAEQWQEWARYSNEIAIAKICGNNHNNHFDKALQSANFSVRSLEKAADAQAKTTQATKENKGELVESWSNIVKYYKESAASYQQSAEAYFLENEIEGNRLGGDFCHKEGVGFKAMETAMKLESQVRALERK